MNKFLLADHGRQMNNNELKAACGILPNPRGHGRYLDWPTGGIETTLVGNVDVRVAPANKVRGGRQMQHRAEASCPYCGLWIPAGRLHQHLLGAKQCVDQGSRDHYIAEQKRIRAEWRAKNG